MSKAAPLQSEWPVDGGAAAGAPVLTGLSFTIGEVSALLGLPASTIRFWERRHALSTGTRDEHGHRCYSNDDVAVLRRLHNQEVAGVMPSQAVAAGTGASPLALCLLLLAAIDRLDGGQVAAVLDASLAAYGLPATLDEVLLPSMREVDARWSRGECDAAQEQLVTGAVLTWLDGLAAAAPPPLHERPIVLSCGPQDRHTLALEAFAVLLRQQRFDCRSLGAQTPPSTLRLAVEQCSAQAVVLVCQLRGNRPAAAAALQGVRPSGAALFYAGAGFRTAASRQKMPGHYLGGSMSGAATYITTRLRHG